MHLRISYSVIFVILFMFLYHTHNKSIRPKKWTLEFLLPYEISWHSIELFLEWNITSIKIHDVHNTACFICGLDVPLIKRNCAWKEFRIEFKRKEFSNQIFYLKLLLVRWRRWLWRSGFTSRQNDVSGMFNENSKQSKTHNFN